MKILHMSFDKHVKRAAVAALALAGGFSATGAETPATKEQAVSYYKDIRPIFNKS